MHLASLTAAVLAATAFAQCIDAWTITTSDATRSEDVVGAHQEFTKTWTVSGNSSLDAIRFAAAGPVFIDVDGSLKPAPATETPAPTTETPAPTTEAPVLTPLPTTGGSGSGSSFRGLPTLALEATSTDSVVAKIVFTGNCTDLLNVFEVVDHDGEVKVHFKNQDYHGYGYILTQVYVADADSLRQVTASGDSSVYISEHVIATGGNDTEVSLKISGDGSVFVTAPSTDLTLKSLDLKISGDGTIQFNTSSLTVSDSLDSKISGDGTIAVLASNNISVNNTLTSKISGDGDIFVLADSVDTFSLESIISGEGSIVVARNGSAVSQDISISGEGTVSTGSIVAADTKLKLSGEGDVLVQTTGTFQVPSYIDGKVQYVGATPQQITDGKPHPPHKPKKEKKHKKHGFYFGWWDDEDDDDDDSSDSSEDDEHRLPKSVTRAPENVYKTYEVQSVPAREPEFLILSLRQNWWGEDPNTHFVLQIFGVDIGGTFVQTTQSLAARVKKHSHKHVTGAIGLAGVALVAAGVAVHKLKTRSRRREYQPLLQTFRN